MWDFKHIYGKVHHQKQCGEPLYQKMGQYIPFPCSIYESVEQLSGFKERKK